MDKDKSADGNGQCTWLEMQQFIGDLITSGNASSQAREQQDVFHVAWGLSGGEYLGLKAPVQDRLEPGFSQQLTQPPGTAERRAECRDRREVESELHACSCPGCPFSTSPPCYETLKPRKQSYSQAQPEAASHPKHLSGAPLGVCLPEEDPAEPSSTSGAPQPKPRQTGLPQRERRKAVGQGAGVASDLSARSSPPPRGSPPSLSHLSVFPCLCCHRRIQACAQILRQQEGADPAPPHAQTHAHHHHFHHHHCPFTSCLPCPQLTARPHPHGTHPPDHFPCLPCPRSFAACAQLCHGQRGAPPLSLPQQQQEDRARATGSPSHPCMHCAAWFSRPSQLLQHQRAEHAHKPAGFLCTECGRAFNSQSNLRIHLNVHTGARPYSCADCGKSFSQSGALKIHRRIHTGEKPYSCAFCGRGFPHLAGVRAHQRTHTGEKPYRCSHCGKCFTQSGALKIHVRIHTGERPFVCGVCGKGFSNRSGIRFHHRTVHGLASEPAGGPGGPGGAYRGPPGHTAGRPRTNPSAGVLLNPCGSPESDSRAAAAAAAAQSSGPAWPPLHARPGGHKSQPEGEERGGEKMAYVCEDCGLRFKDAPSRNRHQTVAHYSEDGGGGEDTRAGRKAVSGGGGGVQGDGEDGMRI